MTIREKVAAVENVFAELGADIAKFQRESGLFCISGCGECCKKPDIEATVLEFLPLAFYLHREHLDRVVLETLDQQTVSTTCTFFSAILPGYQSGMCSMYVHRGLICRLFGFSAFRDKMGRPVLSTCKIIKTQQTEKYQTAIAAINEGGFVPIMNQYYMKLLSIDLDLGNKFYPINKAIQLAIEKVSLYCAYEEQEVV